MNHWVVTYLTRDGRAGKAVFATLPEAKAFSRLVRGDKPVQQEVKFGR